MIPYTIQVHPRAKNVKIKILPNGEVVVVRPKYGWMLRSIDSFVQENEAWIKKNLKKVQQRKPAKSVQQKNEVLVFGKTYRKKIAYSSEQRIGIKIFDDEMVINPVSDTAKSVEKALEQFLKTTAEKYIVPRTHQLGKKMDISFKNITLRNQKTRWGSCSSEGNLNFNWRLVHSPPPVIDYVIIHELAHRKQMNHSARFWELVGKYDPEYLKHRGWLKRQGMGLE